MKKIFLFILSVLLLANLAYAGNKEKKNKIKTRTQYTTVYEKGKELTYKESYEEFNKEGKQLLKIEYKSDGSIARKESAKYDAYGNATEEVVVDNEKDKFSKMTYKYNADNEKSEEVEYNKAGEVIKKTIFNYNSNGDRSAEVVFDGEGKLLKKIVYSLNTKGLRTEKKTYNSTDVLESLKKWEFIYY